MRSFLRVAVGLALAPALVLGRALPSEHVHAADADHPQAVVHRHQDAHEPAAARHHDPEIGDADHDDDGDVIWLDSLPVGQRVFQVQMPAIACALRADRPSPASSWIAIPHNDACPAHGPPARVASLRGPPLPPA